ncbi:MAG: hypothetical protein A2312_01400 [Candidatus Staskawiczbacteria bacterium RIFOXYB2_FULL_32_9]|uniref:Nucleotidyl transferase AbiEii/AbiGii toxin family protein n=1 Tax=Candidatus Staskawiczbacteria bacterium RIFOXYD1_FULL_32_13 TaxID=1802234 RepID=A0A1G2JP22_9BACT|nr:MAG: hypothetical protein UR22_C0002G0004 [Parcubacteria group bacterium GW2011_GWC2_32_10]OGZ77624.1 MAG: hypothetical protein A2256_01400 [Candidatus Staskawiczbacteria bacterium RIFOXYA2_FULL_32_7]OGZ78121.1 MAG: hypothetical protein A2360_00765 [Candidatus Staskawiczbacteria bacterium RIFOXYB1_FULL_32_11]OGZ82019.1 MAG: hypothetical protein A2312_01400 [Candidatus Staskawiczbacteria bacterium RIFOXYB2_FULL_32_9]OGZ88703.1 MAG: hypothetical protein A2561_02980 [Candidatus Staskawiczbacter
MSKLHFELLDKNQKECLVILTNFTKYGVLGGGTALMLQLAFRKSFDFDIFTPKPISKQFLYKVKEHFKSINITVNTSDELSFISLPQEVKVSFIYYPYKSLHKIIPSDYISVFNWYDIALDKAHTIGRRGVWRDYVDMYFILKSGFSLQEIIKQSVKKFGDSFSEKLFLSQLVYFKDLENFTIEFLDQKYLQKDIEKFLEEQVGRISLK